MVLRRNPTPPKPKPFKLKPLSYFIGEDGVAFSVDWTKMKVGSSIFIPCLKCSVLRYKAFLIANRLKYTIKLLLRAELGIQGLRIWRIK